MENPLVFPKQHSIDRGSLTIFMSIDSAVRKNKEIWTEQATDCNVLQSLSKKIFARESSHQLQSLVEMTEFDRNHLETKHLVCIFLN